MTYRELEKSISKLPNSVKDKHVHIGGYRIYYDKPLHACHFEFGSDEYHYFDSGRMRMRIYKKAFK